MHMGRTDGDRRAGREEVVCGFETALALQGHVSRSPPHVPGEEGG